MKRFYLFWFFFAAGWGYLMSEPFPNAPQARTLAMSFASLPVGAITFFLLFSIELWRLGPNAKLPRPSLSLKPWNVRMGLPIFVLMTFLFSSVWGTVFALSKSNGYVTEPLHFFLLSVGGLTGIWLVYRLFPSRFSC